MTFNFYAMFPFDNVCEVEDSSVDTQYLGTWNIKIDAKGKSIFEYIRSFFASSSNTKLDPDLEIIEITQNRPSYKFCNQNILRKIVFPPTPANLLRTSDDWLSENR
eukprot:860688_1